MTLPHAIYGSATGLGDYRILASTAPFDERLRSTIIYYANLEGRARSTPFRGECLVPSPRSAGRG